MNNALQTTNLAWDLQFIVPKYEVKKDYGFKHRAIYRARCSRDEILREYGEWKKH